MCGVSERVCCVYVCVCVCVLLVHISFSFWEGGGGRGGLLSNILKFRTSYSKKKNRLSPFQSYSNLYHFMHIATILGTACSTGHATNSFYIPFTFYMWIKMSLYILSLSWLALLTAFSVSV